MTENFKDPLGDRIKSYEKIGSASDRLMPQLPIIARMDGKAFHTFTKGLNRPYDERLSKLMVATTEFLVEVSNAKIGYTQSDEITLVLYSDTPKSQVFFDGRRDKLVSILASYATLYFNRHLSEYLPGKCDINDERAPIFDARVFSVPTMCEAVNTLIWREQDATRNSISMAAQSQFSHKELHGVSSEQKQEMLHERSQINWNDYPAFFKRGTYVRRKMVLKPFDSAELDRLPPKHEARSNPGLVVERHIVERMEIPPLSRVANRIGLVFNGDDVVQS